MASLAEQRGGESYFSRWVPHAPAIGQQVHPFGKAGSLSINFSLLFSRPIPILTSLSSSVVSRALGRLICITVKGIVCVGNIKESDIGMAAIVETLSKLQCLDISSCRKVTDK